MSEWKTCFNPYTHMAQLVKPLMVDNHVWQTINNEHYPQFWTVVHLWDGHQKSSPIQTTAANMHSVSLSRHSVSNQITLNN